MCDEKKLIIYTSFPYIPRLETELEIAERHLNAGYNVTFLSCMGGLKTCTDNTKHRKLKCLSCTSRLHAGYKWIGKNRTTLKRMYNVSSEQRKVIDKLMSKPLNCWEDLRAIQIDGDDVGEAAFSELVSNIRETHPDLNKKNLVFATKLLENSLIVHFSLLNHLVKEKPDKLILFNGRISAYRPALRVGVSLGIDTKVFEVSAKFNKYMLTDMTYPHNPISLGKQLLMTYEKSTHTEEEKKKIASEWFTERMGGISTDQYIFTRNQKKGYGLLEIENVSNLKVGIFVSSEDELLAIAEYKSPFYEDQNSAIAQITDDLKDEDISFIVRVHPNLMGLNNTQTKGLREVCFLKSNIKYIPPESKVSTYELMDACDVVLVFGSTVGIEAVHKGKPTILMGQAPYRGFGGTIEPDSHEELIKILKESAELGHIPEQYVPSDEAMRRATTIYAFGLLEFGINQQYQKPKNFHKISWIEKDGVKTYIRPHIIYRITDFIYRIVGIPGRLFHRYLRNLRAHLYMVEYRKMQL
ncbi:hypothetical protein KA005_39000 [bacterium]|nr:hypothetical protein [bacterium]